MIIIIINDIGKLGYSTFVCISRFLYHQAVLSLLSRLALPLLYIKTNRYINVDFVQLQLDI